MKFTFEYYETCGGAVELDEKESQKVKNYMDEHDISFEQAYWDLVNLDELPEPWELCDMEYVESEIVNIWEEE